MNWDAWLSVALTIFALGTLAFTHIGPHMVMMAILIILSISGILTSSEALEGFSNSGLITVAAMFIVAAGINATGGIDLLVNRFLGLPKEIRNAQTRIVLPTVLLSGFLNNTPVVATMIPALHAWSKKIGIAPSKLMIPLSYAAILGGTLTLIGTSTNLVVNGQYQVLTGLNGFSLFSISHIGLPVAIVGVLYMIWFFPKQLPDHKDETMFGNMREFTLEVAIASQGPLVGKTVQEAGLRNLERVYLVEIERDGHIVTAVPSEEILEGGDRLVFVGDTQAISDLMRINGIIPSTSGEYPLLNQDRVERRLVEAVISPHSDCIGETIRDSRFRDRYGAVVLAVARGGERVAGNLSTITLNAGDTLLLEARPAFVSRQRYNKDFLLVNDLDTETPRYHLAFLSWFILAGIIVLATSELTSMLNAALLGAAAMLATGCCSANQAQKSLDLSVIVTIAASFALGAALHKTGVASHVAENVVSFSGGNPWLILALTYITVSILTEFITNNSAAIIMLPISLEIAHNAGLDAEPFVFAIMMAASASFATPLGYQTNLMVYGPGGYKFSDFLRIGIPMNIVIGITTILVIGFSYLI